jgi:aryl-alcohol dehydrogenase-like predicted oxidoreductase
MRYRNLGSSNLSVSIVGLGTNNFGGRITDHAESTRVVHEAIDQGVNLIDTAIGYGGGESEVHVGHATKDRRDKVLIATKFRVEVPEGKSLAEHIVEQCEISLGRLQTDHIDLYQLHWPKFNLSPEEILEPLAKLVQQGKVLEIGECNYSAYRLAETNTVAAFKGLPKMVSAQHNYNIMSRQAELEIFPYCEENDVGFLPYSPLGGGYLTGKYQAGKPAPEGTRGVGGGGEVGRLRNDRNEAILEPLETFAKERGHGLLDLAFACLLAHSQVSSVIAGAMTPEQIRGNVAAGEWELTPKELAEVNSIAPYEAGGIRGPEREAGRGI